MVSWYVSAQDLHDDPRRHTLGQQQRKIVYGKNRAEAAAKITKLQSTVIRGDAVVNERTTLATFLEDWLAMIKSNREHATWAGQEQKIRLHIRWNAQTATGNCPKTPPGQGICGGATWNRTRDLSIIRPDDGLSPHTTAPPLSRIERSLRWG